MSKALPIIFAVGMACSAPTCAHGQNLAGATSLATDKGSGAKPTSEPLLDGLKLESQAARFARDDAAEPVYRITPPDWTDNHPDWLEPHRLVSATAFEELPHQVLVGPPSQPSSFWERWRQHRLERRRRPASWFRYPFYLEKFTSIVHPNEPVHDQLHNGQGNLFGGRLGWDFAPRWGVETRLGYLRSTMKDTLHPQLPVPHENFIFWDTTALFYLRGDVRWRPFLELGVGVVNIGFIDNQSVLWNQTLLTMPFGAGFKFLISEHNAVRFEVLDNLIFENGRGGNSRATSELAVGFAYERRFGRPHKTYFPKADANRWTRCREWWESMSN